MADEYIRKDDAIDTVSKECFELRGVFGRCEDALKALPPADVALVVRCRDCEHYYFADNRIPQEQRYVCEISGEIWKPDDFCSFGKRREE